MMKKLLTSLTFFAFSISRVWAASGGGITNPAIGTLGNNPDAAQKGVIFARYFIVLWRALISIGALAVIILFLQGGIEWVTSGGDSGKLEKARNRMVQSAIGLFVLVSSFTIIAYVSKLFFGADFQILKLTFPSAVNSLGSTGGGGNSNIGD